MLFLRPDIVLIELLSERPHVHEEDAGFQARSVFLSDEGLLDGKHATHGGTVRVSDLNIPAPDALNERHSLWHPAVGGSQNHAPVRACCAEHSLQLAGREHVLEHAISVFRLQPGIEFREARGQYDGADVDLDELLLAGEAYGARLALRLAHTASDAVVPVYGVNGRDRLWVFEIYRFPQFEPLVVLVPYLYRTSECAKAATGAFGFVHIPGLSLDGHSETARLSFYRINVTCHHQLHVLMPARRNELG